MCKCPIIYACYHRSLMCSIRISQFYLFSCHRNWKTH
uniref:Uncharacterized protein n=1 Tax=Arundo donax TaxID=35708 RepID=A0A0A9FVV4_ARUDO